MSENNKLKQNSAITLIALVLTIIVLLILSAVTLNLVLGENGLFAKAKQAKEDYKSAEELELGKLDELNNNADSIINNGRAGESNSDSQSNTSVNYSADETEIGTWMGEKLYRKAYEFDVSFSSNHKVEEKNANLSVADKIVKIDTVTYDGDYNPCPLYASTTYQNIYYYSLDDKFIIQSDNNYSITKVYIIVEYTKKANT